MASVKDETEVGETNPKRGDVVYVLIYTHRHGEDFGIHSSYAGAVRGIWELINEYISDFDAKATEHQKAFLQSAIADGSANAAIRAWSDVLDEEGFDIVRRVVE